MKTLFEVKSRDLAARIGVLHTQHGDIETPNIFPVINPMRQIIPAGQMKQFGAQAVITNSYILWKQRQEEVLQKGVHDLIGFDGPVMTDSGAFQLMEYGDIEVSNQEIMKFQEDIGVDVGVILDIPTSSTKREDVEKAVRVTIERAKEASKLIENSNVLWSGPVQGSVYPDLVKKCAREVGKLPFALHPIGSVVPLLVQYKFAELVPAITAAKNQLPMDRPVHLFGAGHPMFFSFAAALGVDLFDSAAYALYAKDNRYLTQTGTLHLDEIKYLSCNCPVCSKYEPGDFNEELLARHNLHVTFQELNLVKQAIAEGELWELLEQRASAHPNLYKCMSTLSRQGAYFNKFDPFTKKHLFHSSEFSKKQVQVSRAKERISNVKGKATVKFPLFGSVPAKITDCFPFSQLVSPELPKLKDEPDDFEKIKAISEYWFGVNIFPENARIERSRKTGRIRNIQSHDGKMIATFRATDYLVLLHEGSKTLHAKAKFPKHRVVMDDAEAESFVKQGKSVFSKFVKECDPAIVPGKPVLVVNKKDELLASGEALMSAREMKDFKSGSAVQVRWH